MFMTQKAWLPPQGSELELTVRQNQIHPGSHLASRSYANHTTSLSLSFLHQAIEMTSTLVQSC